MQRGGKHVGCPHFNVCLPKEVVFAVQFSLSGKAFLSQVAFTLAALNALDVPRSVQNIEEEPVQDRPLAAGAVYHDFGYAPTVITWIASLSLYVPLPLPLSI